MAKKTKVTTRSYTLGLLAPSNASDWLPLWNRLFQTHYAICRGAQKYGELYLNLRGGLSASLDSELKRDEHWRTLQRGTRRILALGWLSVESARGAEHHPHRIHEVKVGQSLTRKLAERLLREILQTNKKVTQAPALDEWVDDCLLALTANIRSDAVFVNRAASFADWQKAVGDLGQEMTEQSKRILFTMCGDGFASLTLPDAATDKEDDFKVESEAEESDDPDGNDAPKVQLEDAEATEPSNASRRVFGDLFGGDAKEKLSRAAGKGEFAINISKMLNDLGSESPTTATIISFRAQEGLGEIDSSNPTKYPPEVSSSGAPTAVAKRYRKLLVSLKLWPESTQENGIPRTQAVSRYGNQISVRDEQSRQVHINALDLLDACQKTTQDNDGSSDELAIQRVYTPSWARAIADQVAAATGMPTTARQLNEFKRLMFALAARRISQTQTWTKRNEIERHKAAVKEDAAKKKLQEFDNSGKARAWLVEYERKRHEASASRNEFRVTKRMIGECDAVFREWQGIENADERAKQTSLVQEGAEKFGDPAFYSDLSNDPPASVIWQHPQGAEILKQWVRLRQSQHDQQRLKIPRFCHPDPFHHPTWCEFGGSSKPKVWYAWRPETKPKSPEVGGDADGSRRLWLLLPKLDDEQSRAVPMRWRSKRLSNDLGGVRDVAEEPIPRADRLSKAAARLPLCDAQGRYIRYRPVHPFSEAAKGWNARLQIDRVALEQLEKLWDDEQRVWRDGGKALRNANWFLTFAPTLAVSDGPGREIHSKLGWKANPHTELNRKQKRETYARLILSRLPGLRLLSVDLGHRYAAACAVWEALNALKFDMNHVIAEAKKNGWRVDGTTDGLFVHICKPTKRIAKNGRNIDKPIYETIIYRRIGEDYLKDPKTGKSTVSSHPAPWARLERQFFIKLQGEELAPRAASNKGVVNEMKMVRQLAEVLGLTEDEDDVKIRAVDELMSRAVRTLTQALKRHARRAKIAYALDPNTKSIPGIGTSKTEFMIGDDDHIKFLTNSLFDWHSLATDSKWNDPDARKLWNDHIATLEGNWYIDDPKTLDPRADEPTRQQRRRNDEKLRDERLRPIAQKLAHGDRMAMHKAWEERWEKDDGDCALVPNVEIGTKGPPKTKTTTHASGFHAHLRLITDWIMGRRLPGATDNGWRQNVGGLSLTRIATMKSLYQLHKAFAMRARPNEPRGAPEKGETNAGVARSILIAMEKMREQRVKQLASRITAAALGLGGHWKEVERRTRGGKPVLDKDGNVRMKRVWVEDPSPKHPTCHAIVIENLRNYRPDQLQTRRENRALMNWSAGKVRKYLEEACQLHGLHLREVLPNYTSMQCSRMGLPGLRCVDVPIDRTTAEPKIYWWAKVLNAAKKKTGDGKGEKKGDAESRFIVDLAKHLSELKAKGKTLPNTVRIPRNGGDLFVVAPPQSCCTAGHKPCVLCDGRRAVQADLNAAANIGLRALMDPDFAGKWWYVPCSEDKSTGTAVPRVEKVKGSACFGPDSSKPDKFGSLISPKPLAADDKSGKNRGKTKGGENSEGKEITNFWCDASSRPLRNAEAKGFWLPTPAYWRLVKKRAVAALRVFNGLDREIDNKELESDPIEG